MPWKKQRTPSRDFCPTSRLSQPWHTGTFRTLRSADAPLKWFLVSAKRHVLWMGRQNILGLQVDIAVVETGLGGVRDATNVFPPDTLKLAVITAIGLEHQKALGNSLREIVAAKAGACKLTAPRVSLCPLRGHALTQIECFGGYLWTTAK